MQRLHYALAISLALHAVVLWPRLQRQPANEGPSSLQATLRPVAPKPLPPAPTASPKPNPQPVPRSAPTQRIPGTPVLQSPLPQSARSTAPPSVESESGQVVAPSAVPAATGAIQGAGRGPMTEAGATGDALDGLRGYRLAVATQARRFKRYPAQAMEAGWAGTAEIRVEVGADGRPGAASVARSSGHEVLDRAALSMIDAGALRARLPESLRGRSFAVVLPVVFDLDGE